MYVFFVLFCFVYSAGKLSLGPGGQLEAIGGVGSAYSGAINLLGHAAPQSSLLSYLSRAPLETRLTGGLQGIMGLVLSHSAKLQDTGH